jgi:hypothetical protein
MRNIRGQTDSEHLFHLLLAFLHDAGKLDDPNVSTALVRDALRATLAMIEKLVGRAETEQMECALAVTNGRILHATRHGAPVYLQKINGITDCPVCRETAPQFGREPKRIDHEHLRSVLIVAAVDPPPGPPFQEIEDRTLISVSHDLNVDLAPLK